ncbi:hypothetical protein K492DRAFT_170471 [Lichtheimia hyalospora FSU 10163]|nr:hypothetical protein K492DRAFT_170471 [Lichtheimia hyalospora FSU 10163]
MDPHPIDVSRHLANLKTRLNFACFKLHNGWENSTLIDVELKWKKRQKKLYNEIPTPRFTQQDILDKRGQFSSAKIRKAKLTRTYSTPLISTRDPYRKRKHRHPAPEIYHNNDNQIHHPVSSSSAVSTATEHNTLITHHHQPITQNTTAATLPNAVSPTTDNNLLDNNCAINEPSSSSLHKSSPPQQHADGGDITMTTTTTTTTPPVKSSLDFLSYAIEMTEGNNALPSSPQPPLEDTRIGDGLSSSQPQPDISRIAPTLCDDDEEEDDLVGGSQERSTLQSGKWERKRTRSLQNDDRPCARYSGAETESDDQLSPPSSPVTAAAHAIMMFVNDHYSIDRNSKSPSMYD